MTEQEMDRLLKGEKGIDVVLSTGKRMRFDRHALMTPAAMRAVVRRAAGVNMPVYSAEDHDKVVRVMFQVADHDDAKAPQ